MKADKGLGKGPMLVPAAVPPAEMDTFRANFHKATGGSNRLMLFAGDQKVEHMNSDFHGKDIAPDDSHPVHLFEIASKAKIGIFATQLGLISRYALLYPDIPFLVKMNAKTNLIPYTQKDPVSRAWYSVGDVVNFATQTGVRIVGVGYTVYLGSDFEAEMLKEAAQIVYHAHIHGLIAVLWMYPKGKAIKDEHEAQLIAGAAGIAACLGADFAKLKVPLKDRQFKPELLHDAVNAAGNTGILCEGGPHEDPSRFLTDLYEQIHEGGTRGSGTGRNIHQRPLPEAIRMANAIYAITVEGKTVQEAEAIWQGH